MKQQLETRLSELEDLNREVKHLRGEREVRVEPLTIYSIVPLSVRHTLIYLTEHSRRDREAQECNERDAEVRVPHALGSLNYFEYSLIHYDKCAFDYSYSLISTLHWRPLAPPICISSTNNRFDCLLPLLLCILKLSVLS